MVGSIAAKFTRAPLPMVSAPELKAYNLMSCDCGCACATEKQVLMESAAMPASALPNMRFLPKVVGLFLPGIGGPRAAGGVTLLSRLNAPALSEVNRKAPHVWGRFPLLHT